MAMRALYISLMPPGQLAASATPRICRCHQAIDEVKSVAQALGRVLHTADTSCEVVRDDGLWTANQTFTSSSPYTPKRPLSTMSLLEASCLDIGKDFRTVAD